MKKLLREPLLYFAILGAGLFFALDAVADARADAEAQRIVVSSDRVEMIARVFEKTWRRSPSETELKALVDDFVLEEMYYRRAVELGIDKSDVTIRRRLRQKLEFVSDDLAASLEPSDRELEDYLAKHAEDFQSSPTFTFRQVYLSPDQHGDGLQAHAATCLGQLRNGETVEGDRTMLPASLKRVEPSAIDRTFGLGFAGQLAGFEASSWQGPIASSFGLHLIFVDDRTEGELPTLDKVRETVKREWQNERRLELRQEMNEKMLENYEVVIEWNQKGEAK